MSPVSIQTTAFISYTSPVQSRMAGANTSGYKFDSVVRGKSTWTPLTDKMGKCILQEDNKHDNYVVNDRL